MKLVHSLIVFASTLFIGTPASSQNNAADLHLPRLHKIMHATLSPSYSCRSEEQFRTGYANTALFLSDYSRQRNSPELLFNELAIQPIILPGKQREMIWT